MRKLYYLTLIVGITILIFGVGTIGKISIEAFKSFGSEEQKFLVPSEKELFLDEQGTYSVFFEYVSYFDDKVIKSEKDMIHDLSFNVIDADNGAVIEVIDIRKVNFIGQYSVSGEFDIEAREVFRLVLDKASNVVIDTYSSDIDEEMVLCIKKNDAIASLYELKSNAKMLILSQFFGVILIVVSIVMIIKSNKPKKI